MCSFVFIDSLPAIESLVVVYRASILQLPALMAAHTDTGVCFGANTYQKWADDLEGGEYDRCTAKSFDQWGDWNIYICNLATNARRGWDFIAKAYINNPDLPNILHLISRPDRNTDL